MSAASVDHPIFARVFDRLIRLMEREAAEHRRDLLAGLSGRVLELGPATVREVVAVEREPYLRGKAIEAARRAPVPVTVRDGCAEHVRSTRRRKARLQQRFDHWGIWSRITGGCHSARDTLGAIAAAGFAVERVREFHLLPEWSITDPHVLGIARSVPIGASAAALSSAS